MNNWSFTGNTGGDAELRYTPTGTAVASFNMAVKSGYGDKAVTTWARCNLWGKQAESLAQYITKGTLIGIVGELSNRKYQDKDGQDRYSLEVRVTDLTLLGNKQSASDSSSTDAQDYAPPPARERPKPSFDDLEDSITF